MTDDPKFWKAADLTRSDVVLTPELVEQAFETFKNLSASTWSCPWCWSWRSDGGPPIHFDYCPILRTEDECP